METYLIQLALGSGDGMSSTYYYFVADCKTYPVDSLKLDDDVLEELRKKYPENKNILHNSGYHDWSVIGLGSASLVNKLYETYKQTVSQLRTLREFGFRIK